MEDAEDVDDEEAVKVMAERRRIGRKAARIAT
jgi:hypothetical protein